jgi:hypothetical protein
VAYLFLVRPTTNPQPDNKCNIQTFMKTQPMRWFVLLIAILTIIRSAMAGEPPDKQPVYAIKEMADVVIISIDPKMNRAISVSVPPYGGTQHLVVGPKTWIIKDGAEATLADLQEGQHLRVRLIPRGGLAVTLEVLSP